MFPEVKFANCASLIFCSVEGIEILPKLSSFRRASCNLCIAKLSLFLLKKERKKKNKLILLED